MTLMINGARMWGSLMTRVGVTPNGGCKRVASGDENGISHNQAENAESGRPGCGF